MKYRRKENGKFRLTAFAATAAIASAIAACTSITGGGGSSAIDADAAAILKAASAKIAASQQFTLEGNRWIDPGIVDGNRVRLNANVNIAVKRPNKIAGRTVYGNAVQKFFYDGASVTLYDSKPNHYAVIPGAGTIDKTIDKIAEEYNFTPPLADLLVGNPHGSLSRGAQSGKLVGTKSVRGVKCDYIAVSHVAVDWEVWIAQSDSLPRRFRITFKDREGSPQMDAYIHRWNLNANLPDSKFGFTPPKGTQKIEMVPMD